MLPTTIAEKRLEFATRHETIIFQLAMPALCYKIGEKLFGKQQLKSFVLPAL